MDVLLRLKLNYHGSSPDLLDRLAAAPLLGLPIDGEMLRGWKIEIDRMMDDGELDAGWKRVAKLTKQLYEFGGYEWEPCRSRQECAFEAAKQARLKVEEKRVEAAKAKQALVQAELDVAAETVKEFDADMTETNPGLAVFTAAALARKQERERLAKEQGAANAKAAKALKKTVTKKLSGGNRRLS